MLYADDVRKVSEDGGEDVVPPLLSTAEREEPLEGTVAVELGNKFALLLLPEFGAVFDATEDGPGIMRLKGDLPIILSHLVTRGVGKV